MIGLKIINLRGKMTLNIIQKSAIKKQFQTLNKEDLKEIEKILQEVLKK